MSTTNTVRVTKTQKFYGAIALLEGKSPISVPGTEDKAGVVMDANYLCEFFRSEIALLAKKNSPTSKKKLTKDQEKNEQYKLDILHYLSEHPEKIVSATEVMDTVLRPMYPDGMWSSQKVASLLNAMSDKYDKETKELVTEGKLIRTEGKGKNKTTFQIKPEYILAAEDDSAE